MFKNFLELYNWGVWKEVDLYTPWKSKIKRDFPFRCNMVREGNFQKFKKKVKRIDLVAVGKKSKKVLFFEIKFTAQSNHILSALAELSFIDEQKLVLDGVQYTFNFYLLSYFAGNLKMGKSAEKELVCFNICKELFFEKYLDEHCKFLLLDPNIYSRRGLMKNIDAKTRDNILDNQQELLQMLPLEK